MVRLEDLKTSFVFAGTTSSIIGDPIPYNQVRNVYRLKIRQRGATINVLSILANQGATAFATLDNYQFSMIDEQQLLPDGHMPDDAAPFYKVRSADATAIYVVTDVSSADVFMEWEDSPT